MYMNQFDWINQAVGIRSAAKIYFGTTPDQLKTEEAALLVGMLKNPSMFNPNRASKKDTTLHRRMVVLGQMKKLEYITQAREFLEAAFGPMGPLFAIGLLGTFMIALSAPVLLRKKPDPLDKIGNPGIRLAIR